MTSTKRTRHDPFDEGCACFNCRPTHPDDVEPDERPTKTSAEKNVQGALLAMHPDDAALIIAARAKFLECFATVTGAIDKTPIQEAWRMIKERYGDTQHAWYIWHDIVTR